MYLCVTWFQCVSINESVGIKVSLFVFVVVVVFKLANLNCCLVLIDAHTVLKYSK